MGLIRHDFLMSFPERRRLSAARAAARTGAWADAKAHYRDLLDQSQERPALWLQYGHACKEFGDIGDAMDAYRTCAELAPHDPEPHRQLAFLLAREGRRAEAQDAFLRAYAANPSDQELHRELLSLGLMSREIAIFSAISAFELGGLTRWERKRLPSQLSSEILEAVTLPGVRLLAKARRWKPVIRAYRFLLSLAPPRYRLSIQLDMPSKKRGISEQPRMLTAGQSLFAPWQSDAYLHLGHVAKLLGDNGLARYWYAQAWRLGPTAEGVVQEIRAMALSAHEQSQILRQAWLGDFSDDARLSDRFGAGTARKRLSTPPDTLSARGKSIWFILSQSGR